jgi:hypothetical protein
MPSEVDQLQLAVSKLQNPHDFRLTPKLEKDLLFWGAQVYRWTQEIQPKMTTQLKWLDTNTDHPSYQKRLDQWLTTLRQYERGCDLSVKAEEML